MPHGGYHGYSWSFQKKVIDKEKSTPKTTSSIKSAVKKRFRYNCD